MKNGVKMLWIVSSDKMDVCLADNTIYIYVGILFLLKGFYISLADCFLRADFQTYFAILCDFCHTSIIFAGSKQLLDHQTTFIISNLDLELLESALVMTHRIEYAYAPAVFLVTKAVATLVIHLILEYENG